jgi:hypothetical protein
MAEPNVLEQLAALNATLQTIPVGSEDGDHSVEELEEVKRGLDDARLGLWARLQGAHADDVVAFEERRSVDRERRAEPGDPSRPGRSRVPRGVVTPHLLSQCHRIGDLSADALLRRWTKAAHRPDSVHFGKSLPAPR